MEGLLPELAPQRPGTANAQGSPAPFEPKAVDDCLQSRDNMLPERSGRFELLVIENRNALGEKNNFTRINIALLGSSYVSRRTVRSAMIPLTLQSRDKAIALILE